MKKIGLVLLAVVLALTAVLCACSKEPDKQDAANSIGNTQVNEMKNDATGEVFTFRDLNSVAIEITGYQGSDAHHAVMVPDTINGKKVTRIGDETFKNNNSITEITLPDTVTEIGSLAFAGCDYLVTVHFSDSLKTICEDAFYCCGIQSVTLPASLETIGKAAFYDCAALSSVSFSGTSLKTVGEVAFSGCTALTAITVPDGTETVGEFAFLGCEKLESVTLPASATCPDNAFAGTPYRNSKQ